MLIGGSGSGGGGGRLSDASKGAGSSGMGSCPRNIPAFNSSVARNLIAHRRNSSASHVTTCEAVKSRAASRSVSFQSRGSCPKISNCLATLSKSAPASSSRRASSWGSIETTVPTPERPHSFIWVARAYPGKCRFYVNRRVRTAVWSALRVRPCSQETPKQIAGITSGIAVTGIDDHTSRVTLAGFDHPIPDEAGLAVWIAGRRNATVAAAATSGSRRPRPRPGRRDRALLRGPRLAARPGR
jgi:hypothetical protein